MLKYFDQEFDPTLPDNDAGTRPVYQIEPDSNPFSRGERNLGPTFASEDIGWIDFETASKETDLKQAGTYRYATTADAITLAYAFGDEPPQMEAVDTFPMSLVWEKLPPEIHRWHERVLDGAAIWAAWNAQFDRAIWNYATVLFPFMEPQHIIDVMAQATASGLPPDLRVASTICGVAKQKSGKELIKLFCLPTSTATPQSHPKEWQEFTQVYAKGDIASMRAVFKQTRQLSVAEWKEYWAMEAINQRGVGIDLEMINQAAMLANIDRGHVNRTLSRLTDGKVETVDQVARITQWLLPRLPYEAAKILTTREEEIDDEGNITRPAKHALTRQQVQRLIAYAQAVIKRHADAAPQLITELQVMEQVLQIRLYGGSRTPAKFAKMQKQHVNGVLYGQYVFNGAGQTGRASSRGVQVHNLARDVLPYEHEAIEALLNGADYEKFDALDKSTPMARKLSLLIRPTFVPAADHTFVWGDWAQIEARVLPWLAGDRSKGAFNRLQIFREVDADPRQDPKHPEHAKRLPDLYTRSAAAISRIPIAEVTKPIRQRGKIAELALGYMGGVGALQNMAAASGLYLTHDEAQLIVNRWREENKWASNFSQGLWEGMRQAHQHPCQYVPVGRTGFIFLPDYAAGSMLMQLPSGRFLTYRNLKWVYDDVLDEDDQPTGEKKLELKCWRGHKPMKLWPGLFVENVTQAVAADVLRGTLRRLEENKFEVRLHTHDEVLLEVWDEHAGTVGQELKDIMERGFDWSYGLPLKADITTAPYYTKTEA